MKKNYCNIDLFLDHNLNVLLILFIFTLIYGFLIYRKRQLEKNILKSNLLNIELQDLLTAKEFQLKEIHHRIKNNLQIIVSMLNIEASKEKSTIVNDFLLKGQTRIQSISLIHQNLSENEYDGKVILQNYFESIVQNLSLLFPNQVEFEINANYVILDVEVSIPLGLIVTELVTNSLKHAFNEKQGGRIVIEMKKNETKKYSLTLSDNGIGFPDNPPQNKSIGIELVSMMVLQINGNLTRENRKGTFYNLIFFN